MGLLRTQILRGPAKIAYGGLTFWTPDDIALVIDDGAEDRVSSFYGPVDRVVVNPSVTVTFTPQAVTSGTTLTALLAVLIPPIFSNGFYGTAYVGSGAELTLTLWAQGGEQVVLKNAVITKPPTLNFSANKPLFGEVTVTGIVGTTASDIVLGANNSVYTVSTGVADPGGVFAGFQTYLQQRYSGVWGTQTGFTAIWPEDGWTVEFNPSWNERKIQGLTVDYELSGMEILAKCVPTGPTMKQVADLVAIGGTTGASWGQGSLMSAQQTTNDLTIVDPAAATVFTLKRPVIRRPGFRFGYQSLRVNELGWHSQVRFTAGAPGVLAVY